MNSHALSDVLIESVPNFSEGRNPVLLNRIKNAMNGISGANVLDMDIGHDAHRTVYTLAGTPDAVVEALYQGIVLAHKHIDMQKHKGAHPRIGAVDVCPLIPIQGITIENLKPYVVELGQKVWRDLGVPIYFYEESSTHPQRKLLAQLRKGEYEGLEQKMNSGTFLPDIGRAELNHSFGILITGVRKFLIAYNINLRSKDLKAAKHIAQRIRASSHEGMPEVKAIGWYMDAFDCVQISTNLTDFHVTHMGQVFDRIESEAAELGISLNGSELVGLVPLKAMTICAEYYGFTNHFNDDLNDKSLMVHNQEASNSLLENLIPRIHRIPHISINSLEKVSQKLGLNSVKPFNLHDKVLEMRLEAVRKTNPI